MTELAKASEISRIFGTSEIVDFAAIALVFKDSAVTWRINIGLVINHATDIIFYPALLHRLWFRKVPSSHFSNPPKWQPVKPICLSFLIAYKTATNGNRLWPKNWRKRPWTPSAIVWVRRQAMLFYSALDPEKAWWVICSCLKLKGETTNQRKTMELNWRAMNWHHNGACAWKARKTALPTNKEKQSRFYLNGRGRDLRSRLWDSSGGAGHSCGKSPIWQQNLIRRGWEECKKTKMAVVSRGYAWQFIRWKTKLHHFTHQLSL